MKRTPLPERLWPKIDKRGTDDCWPWTGSLTSKGYGQINEGGRYGRRLAAHRVVYELVVGPIPEGHDIDHHCENKACCNPAHLEPVTRQDNMLRFHGKRTECHYGHPLDGIVHGSNPQGLPAIYRYCRTCSRLNNRRRAEEMRRR
jgi:hypothetical protein